MKRFLALLFILFLTVPAHALVGDVRGNDANCSVENSLPIDSNGWTIFPSPNSSGLRGRTYYVSDSLGNDRYNGLYPDHTKGANNGPKKTITQGVLLLKADSGKDSHLLLRKGDTFLNQVFLGGLTPTKGPNCQHPMVLGSYVELQPGVVDPYGYNTISSMSCSGGTVTVTTTSNHGYSSGNNSTINLEITRALPYRYDGDWAAKITALNQFTFQIAFCPGAITQTGIVTTRRPVMETDATSCGPTDGGIGTDYISVVGLECYGYTTDPNNPSYKGQRVNTNNGYFVTSYMPFNWRLYEDDKVSFLNGAWQWSGTGGQANALILRRNIAFRNYSGGGVYASGINQMLIYQNIEEWNGWNPQLTAATPSPCRASIRHRRRAASLIGPTIHSPMTTASNF